MFISASEIGTRVGLIPFLFGEDCTRDGHPILGVPVKPAEVHRKILNYKMERTFRKAGTWLLKYRRVFIL